MADRLFLIRHGELPEPAAKRYPGLRYDPGLAEAGHAACSYLRDLACDLVFSGPSRRARETAAWIAAPLRILPELDEIDFGEWAGLTFEEIARIAAPEQLRCWTETPERMVFPGGESVAAFHRRADAAFARIAAWDAPRIAVVTHGGCLARMLAGIRTGPLPRGAMTELIRENGGWHEAK